MKRQHEIFVLENMSQKYYNRNNLESNEIQLLLSRDAHHIDFKCQDHLKIWNKFNKDLVKNILTRFSLFYFSLIVSRVLFFCSFLLRAVFYVSYVLWSSIIFIHFVYCKARIIYSFFFISKRKSDRINVNDHENKIILYILVLIFFFKWFRFKF